MSSKTRFTRRDLIKAGAVGGAATLLGKNARAQTAACIDQTPIPIDEIAFTGCGVGGEPMATSPFITEPFTQELAIPEALRPGWRYENGTLANPNDPNAWSVRKSAFGAGVVRPGPETGHQDALGDRPALHDELGWGLPHSGTHQQWSKGTGAGGVTLDMPDPVLFHLRLQVATHGFTNSPVVPIAADGSVTTLPTGAKAVAAGATNWFGTQVPAYYLPESTIYGFNGTFGTTMINVEYGRPVLVRVENDLDLNPGCLDRGDFGAPDWAFLTHLHNGHTAPESDGQPHAMLDNEGGYRPMEWVDNLWLGYPAGGDDREKQSFLWFHDHRMHHTGPNVYKGMLGLAPHYDAKLDNGDETKADGLRLPGVRTNNLDADGNYDGTFNVKYDIPMALYDFRSDDGVTAHQDEHTFEQADPRQPGLVCGDVHPENWGKLFHRHYPNHGFVGDIFTVNGTAFPTLHVEARKYRFRFLGASLARQYKLQLQTGTPMPFPGSQGQWNFGKIAAGKQVKTQGTRVMNFTTIASGGGLLPNAIEQDTVEIWPALRREAVVDFSKDANGKPFAPGTVVYLVNVAQMLDGRKMTTKGDIGFDANVSVPMVKIIIGNTAVDNSVLPGPAKVLRASPDFRVEGVAPGRDFTLERGGLGGETEWLINGAQFDPTKPLATPFIGSGETWGVNNGGGGWTHPMHLHMEEHHVTYRSSDIRKYPDHKLDTGKDDVVALEGSEKTRIFRRFRTFLGNYVAHCHNLAHEDHNMMFGWTIRK
ncbi:MAG: multicopper oxidase domain-containing protein [Myxococcales bacterium]